MVVEDRLREVRERAALTQEQVAGALGVPRETVSYWETGARIPNRVRLEQLARLYRVNAGYLRGEELLDERAGREVLYRGLPMDHPKARLEVATWLDFLDAWADFVEDHGGTGGRRKPPRALDEGYVDDVRRASKFASRVRQTFDLGLDPLPDLRVLLDEVGLLVYSAPLGGLEGTEGGSSGGVSGAFYNHPQLGWSILVNTNTTERRQAFTLAHEFAHALFHYQEGGVISRQDQKGDPKERFANAFAAHLLVPSKSLRAWVKHYGGKEELDPLLVLRLADYFAVSYRMLLWRLVSENLLDDANRQAFESRSVAAMARQLGLPTPPFAKPNEAAEPGVGRLPLSVLDRVKDEIEVGTLSPSQAAGILGVDEMELQESLFAAAEAPGEADRQERDEYPFAFG